ncbi:dethiobiotin synthetase [Aquimarina sp. EL_43]|uniref:dethiobiotin synthase n=1 Tax=unclassified Aquimarina TaxID=2627091 RepID=UPI0018C91A6E|nr:MULTISPECIES: dethiobiotin synthase [unclassified Aquimarina]MBG6132013.1 dethiobiotin synthetase [Aquimarina sp. EL_35]MBG6149577.1 dethiobiotin synthetase [Aquimarina sp. EL_32]MBG6170160.1 dethiobiotin synthetase [Aquimarina sp. EL_43]
MNKKIFVTGIGTEVGKTIASAIVVESLQADYFKPIQAGDLEYSDTDKVQELVSNSKSKFHSNSYALKTPMSPHAAAEIDQISIEIDKITLPKTNNDLIIEGAGGLLVPLNNNNTILDLIQSDYHVIVVSRHYLGSINHTLMTIQILKEKGYNVSVIFNGAAHKTTESIIKKMTGVPVIGRIDNEPYFDKMVVSEYAELFRDQLKSL